MAVTQLDERQRLEDLDGHRFSLSFSEPVPVRDVFTLIVRDTNFSLVSDPGLEQTFTGELKNVTLREALELILDPVGLDYSVDGNVIRVFRKRMETRIFEIDYVLTRRSGSRGLSATTGGGGGGAAVGGVAGAAGTAATGGTVVGGAGGGGGVGGSSASVSGTDAGDLFEDLSEGLATLMSEEGRFNLDRKAGLLQVTDFPDRLEKISLYVEAVQNRVHRQVQIQAHVIEVELREEFSAGINWSTVLRAAANSVTLGQSLTPSTTGAFTMGVNIRDFTGLLTAFGTQGKVNVLSSPRVIAMHNEPAIMRVGTQDIFFVTTSQVDAESGRILQTTVTPQPVTEGVVLSVTPHISGNGVINMSISPSITERLGQATSRLGDTVPIISVRETDTLVRVHQGDTIVIAGLMQDRLNISKSKVPLLGDVPIVGGLFRREEKSKRKTDLVILITPTVMTPGEIVSATARDRERLYEAQKATVKK